MAEEKQPKHQKPEPKQEPKAEEKDSFRYIVRVANTDLNGKKQILFALKKVKGVGYSIACASCKLSGIDFSRRAGDLTEAETDKLTATIEGIGKLGVPKWLFNRRNDPETGVDLHLLGGDLQFARENDIKLMKKIRCYKGVRHSLGQPVRGQRTKSNFRVSKSRGKGSLGVQKSKVGKK